MAWMAGKVETEREEKEESPGERVVVGRLRNLVGRMAVTKVKTVVQMEDFCGVKSWISMSWLPELMLEMTTYK
jgi:hypothetical protein